MSALVIDQLSKRFGSFTAVDQVQLEVPSGSFVCLLGPSGCGKTTLLRMIAGLEEPSAGCIRLGAHDITKVPTHQRNIGMVFQSLALFVHLSVGQNIAYALRIRGIPKEQQERRVHELLEMVHLGGFGERPVASLSGGQRQRVAIARALAHAPRLFLLDEPLSALDAKLREAMQVELRQLQQALGITTVVVTHDQREAMTMADMVVVMGQGRIRQAAAPVEVYRNPADAFVAGFIGSTNLLPVACASDGTTMLWGHPLAGVGMPGGLRAGVLSVRPEDVTLVRPGAGVLDAKVTFVRDLGATVETFVSVGDTTLVSAASPHDRAAVGVGASVGVALVTRHCVVFAP